LDIILDKGLFGEDLDQEDVVGDAEDEDDSGFNF
jgi:hypothetical protein